ncbi:hypothetical protein GIB67_034006 [Kingdonia uniflora]|uniref:PUM-HD domain-containing protein n=1 Tax=Kingdonia uniflora TaxID=39325 RepID=A0A7J7M608_9MAGN|nr:hypothetical protein GIB67_034006 [Kingdonia uniflora]
MLSEMGSFGEDLGKELGMLRREQRWQEANDRERELNVYRSGSAPPTVQGSLAAVGGLFGGGGQSGVNSSLTDDEIRSDPAYLSYYYSNGNLNPRLPPPLLSKEDWRVAQRSGLGGIGDRRRVSNNNHVGEGGNRSLFSSQPGFNSQKEEGELDSRQLQSSAEWGSDGLIGFSGIGLGNKKKSLADIFQDDMGRTSPIPVHHPSRPASRNAFSNDVDTMGSVEAQLAQLHHELAFPDALLSGSVPGLSSAQTIGASASHAFPSSLSPSLSGSTTPHPQLISRAPSPGLPPVGANKRINNGLKSFNGISSGMSDSTDLVAALSGMSLSANAGDGEMHQQSQIQQQIDDHQNFLFNLPSGQSHIKQNLYLTKSNSGNFGSTKALNVVGDLGVEQINHEQSAHFYLNGATGSPSHYHYSDGTNPGFANYGLNAHPVNQALPSMMASQFGNSNLPPLYENVAAASVMVANGIDSRAFYGGLPLGTNLSGAVELQNLQRIGNQTVPVMDPMYLQYLAHFAAVNDPSIDRSYMGNSNVDLLELQKAYIAALSPQKSPYGVPFLGKSLALNPGYYGNPTFGLGSYPGSPVGPNSPVGPGSPMRHNERNMRFPSGMKNLGVMGSWHSEAGAESFPSSLLEEFKSNKTRCFELSEIAGYVGEFSSDQYGSRFIQQKLETATVEEKNMVFEEIMPQAFSLMTDVFGNYVIQKFFEHGTSSQTRELANVLNGNVLALSLQMYGCRVIQKAIEVVDLDQQTKMVAELDGHIMRCVRDQNGNHVIQKCIECIPQEEIQFIISTFYNQVVTLSTHPYGCRVIQRVLEHCSDPKTQQIMMDEIMNSVCMLGHDQYGNYVVQHVLQHGKPNERSCIIKKLAGQIVQMSQEKYASNVVEKCLSFGGPAERQILVNEMLGTTDENEPLQAMMKDQFGNYVVQKVLETSDDQQREMILSRIKVHLNALKKYTYGKHIVARVEKLVAAGGLSTTKDTGSGRGLSTTKVRGPLRHNSFPDLEHEYKGYPEINGRGLDPRMFGPLVDDDNDIPQSNEFFKIICIDVPPSNEPSIPQSNMRGSIDHAYQLLTSYFAEVRYGVAYTNYVESWNNVILKVTDPPIHVFIEELREICSEMSYTYKEEAEKSQARLTPWATDHCESRKFVEDSLTCRVRTLRHHFQMTSYGRTDSVNIEDGTCSYRWW